MSETLDRLESKIDRMSERLSNVDVTLVRQHVTLEEHIKRTAQMETALTRHFGDDQTALAGIQVQLAPLQVNRSMWAGAGKLWGFVIAGVTILIELLHTLGGHG